MPETPADWARVVADSVVSDRKLRRRLMVWERSAQARGLKLTARAEGPDVVFEAWDPKTQARAIDSFVDHPGLTEQLAAIQGLQPRPWRAAGAREALGVPAIHRAVTLISNTAASLTVRGYRNGVEMIPDDRPAIFKRPNPLQVPRTFFRDTTYSLATRGEFIWWVAKRDSDSLATALMVLNPAEVSITENPKDPRYPLIDWRGRRMPNRDIRHVTLMQELGSLRGYGPLQVCGAAVSVSVEAQEWAANFFASGGVPSVVIKVAGLLGGDPDQTADDFDADDRDTWDTEANRLRNQWISVPNNMPRVIDENIESVEPFNIDGAGAQLNEAREFQNGEAARMFGIPSSLLDHSTPGSNLTYQNLEQELNKFVRTCLLPNYLEPIEQELSDLAARSITARFNVDDFLRADIKTRYEVYELGVTKSGVLTVEEARRMEGMDAGNIETAPVPQALPASIPAIPLARAAAEPVEVRCPNRFSVRGIMRQCNHNLGELSAPYKVKCGRCKEIVEAA